MKKTIIFTRYNDPANCILEILKNTDINIVVYDRGIQKLDLPKSDRLNHIYDENIGRECGGYIRHIIENYNSLDDILIFSQAIYDNHPYEHFKNNIFDWIKQLNQNNSYESFITQELECDYEGKPHSYDLTMNESWEYIFKNKNFPITYKFFPCAIFSVNSNSIKKHPIEFYQNIYNKLKSQKNWVLHGDGGSFTWCLERFWGYIFK